jgi:hypothetical protein
MSWHGDTTTFELYASGDADGASAASLEAHLLRCGRCRDRIRRFAPPAPLDAAWAAIEGELDQRATGTVERVLRRVGVRDHLARLLAATPSLRMSWFAAVGLALAFAVAASHTGQLGVFLFLVIAPLVPLAGVAVAYGPGVDPTYEIGLAAPMRSYRLLLIRAVAVLATSIALAGAAALLLPVVDWTSAAWLIPSLALTAASLALSTSVRPVLAATSVAVAWIAVAVVVEAAARERYAVFHLGGQIALLVVAVVGVAVIAARRDAFETGRGR